VLWALAGLLSLSCCALIGPWVLIWLGFVMEDLGKERAERNYKPTSLADAVDMKYATPEVVAGFIDQGGDVNQRLPGVNGAPPRPLIAVAANRGDLDVVRLLLERGAHVDDAGLWELVRAHHGDMARLLLEKGASTAPWPGADPEIGPELIQAAAIGREPWLIERLAAKGADVNLRNAHGASLLALAIENESMDPGPESNSATTTKALLALGADPRLPDERGTTPLHWAAHNSKLAEMELLIAAGAPLEAQTVEKATPLSEAVEWCRDDAVAILLSHNASRSVVTTQGLSLDKGACWYGYPELNKKKKEKILALLAKS